MYPHRVETGFMAPPAPPGLAAPSYMGPAAANPSFQQERELLIKQRDQLLATWASLMAQQKAYVDYASVPAVPVFKPPHPLPTVPAFRPPPGLSLPSQEHVQTANACGKHRRKVGSEDLSDVASTCSGSADSSEVASNSDASSTTVIMRNIPNRFSHAALAAVLDKHGFFGAYDLVYLPFDFSTGVSFGYAFVNLITADEAERFTASFDGFSQWGGSSQKVCRVVPCHDNETLSERVERYRNLPVMHSSVPDSFKPVLYSAGQPVPFPAPTKRLRPPRVLAGKK